MAVIPFRSTTYFKAFLLYALISAIAASIAVHIRLQIDDEKSVVGAWIHNTLEKNLKGKWGDVTIHRLLIAILITFLVSIIIYHLMYFIFGWGGGLLVPNSIKNSRYF